MPLLSLTGRVTTQQSHIPVYNFQPPPLQLFFFFLVPFEIFLLRLLFSLTTILHLTEIECLGPPLRLNTPVCSEYIAHGDLLPYHIIFSLPSHSGYSRNKG